jgi:hypothetical protein
MDFCAKAPVFAGKAGRKSTISPLVVIVFPEMYSVFEFIYLFFEKYAFSLHICAELL